jgi:hypothetical protein
MSLRKAGPGARRPSTCPRYQCCLHSVHPQGRPGQRSTFFLLVGSAFKRQISSNLKHSAAVWTPEALERAQHSSSLTQPVAMVEPNAAVRPRSNKMSAPQVSWPMHTVDCCSAEHGAPRLCQQQAPEQSSSKHAQGCKTSSSRLL